MNDKIDRYLKERLVELEQMPPETSWNQIARKLGHNRKKSLVLLMFRIAAGMAILVSTGIGYYLLTKPEGQPEPAALSINQADVMHKDTIKLTRPIKRNAVKKPEKKSHESDRLNPVRKVYQGHAMSEEISDKPLAQLDTREVIGISVGNFESSALTSIAGYHKHLLLQVNLPSELTYAHSSSTNELTTAEALNLLLADYEEVETEKVKQDRWTMSGEVAPLYSHRSIASDKLQSDVIDNLNKNESGLLAYAGGIRIAFSTGRRISVQSGIYYSRYGQEKNKVATTSNKSLADSYGLAGSKSYVSVTNSTGVISSSNTENTRYDIVVSDNTATGEFNSSNGLISAEDLYPSVSKDADISLIQYFDYLEVPLLFKYKVIDRKIDFSFSGGLVTNFLIGNAVNMIQDGESTRLGETKDINQVNYQGSFGMGFEYPIISGFAFTIEPRFRYYINPIDKSSQINVRPYSFGLFAGISYVF